MDWFNDADDEVPMSSVSLLTHLLAKIDCLICLDRCTKSKSRSFLRASAIQRQDIIVTFREPNVNILMNERHRLLLSDKKPQLSHHVTHSSTLKPRWRAKILVTKPKKMKIMTVSTIISMFYFSGINATLFQIFL